MAECNVGKLFSGRNAGPCVLGQTRHHQRWHTNLSLCCQSSAPGDGSGGRSCLPKCCLGWNFPFQPRRQRVSFVCSRCRVKSTVRVELLQSRLLESWRSPQEEQCQICLPELRATIVLSNTFWSTGALLPEIHFVDLLVNNSSCDACSSSYYGFSSLWSCKSLSPHCISLRAAGISVFFCLASSQSLCSALSLPDSLQGSPYCEGLGEERGGPQHNEDTSFFACLPDNC